MKVRPENPPPIAIIVTLTPIPNAEKIPDIKKPAVWGTLILSDNCKYLSVEKK